MQEPSTALEVGFAALSGVVALGFVAQVGWASALAGETRDRRWQRLRNAGGGVILWMSLTAGLAVAGLLRFGPPVPTALLLFAVSFAGSVWLSRSALGSLLANQLPVAWLVGHQAFRIVVELLLHQAHAEGVIGVQMTYLDRNFDVVSGVGGLLLGLVLLGRQLPHWLLLTWNWLGLALLVNIVTIAILSAPTPFRVFVEGPPNVFVTQVPFVWLPVVLVQAALVGHLLLFRRLSAR